MLLLTGRALVDERLTLEGPLALRGQLAIFPILVKASWHLMPVPGAGLAQTAAQRCRGFQGLHVSLFWRTSVVSSGVQGIVGYTTKRV